MVVQHQGYDLRTLKLEIKSMSETVKDLNHLSWLSVPKKILLKDVIL